MALKGYSPRTLWARLVALAPEREIFLRTGGKVRFLRITTRTQLIAGGAVAAFALSWSAGAAAVLWTNASLAVERASLAHDQRNIDHREAQVGAYRQHVDDIARDIEQRQNALDQIVKDSFGKAPDGQAQESLAQPATAKDKTSSAVSPEIGRLERLQQRQEAFEARLKDAARDRMAQVETAIRSFGLDPARLSAGKAARGGPYIPAPAAIAAEPELRDLALLLGRLNDLETTLAAIPSSRPTNAPMETSSYGYRRDPFNGMPAFHAGIDFPGQYGQPILAAARGTVSYVGPRAGYGHVVEVDHGHGLMTRYAHLSGYVARIGDKVARGQQVGKMGSTGRSTGTHLHFEVRVNGAAVNPRPFLEAREDVLEVQQLAKQRTVASGNRG